MHADAVREEGEEGASPTWAALLARHAPDAILAVRGGRITWSSPNSQDVVGRDASGLEGLALDALVHPDDADAVRSACLTATAGDHRMLVAGARPAGGFPVPVEMRVTPNTDAAIDADAVVLVRDIRETLALREQARKGELAPQRLAERAGDVFFVVNAEGQVLDCGEAIAPMLGWRPDEVRGIHLPDLIHPDDHEAAGAYRQAVQDDRADGSIEIRVRTKGGGFRWVLATGVVIREPSDGARDGTRVLVSWRDIDRLVLETRFAQREAARLRLVMDTALDPWLMLGPLRDHHGEITDFIIEDANTGAAEYLDWPRERLLGTRLLEEFPGVAQEGLMSMYIEAVDTGGAVVIHDLAYPHEVFGETRTYELRAQSVGGSLMLTWRDTTASHMAQDDLARSAAFFRHTAQASGDFVVAMRDGVVRWLSPGSANLGLVVGGDFEGAMSAVVTDEDMGAVRACCVLVNSGHRYAGRWHRAADRALVVHGAPINGDAGAGVIILIEETWVG